MTCRTWPSSPATLALALLLFTRPGPVDARVGLAEWEVYTPGGHLISDTDAQDPTVTPCLRTDARPDASRAEILVPRLKRWRFYADHVAGESEGGFFVFNESSGDLSRLRSEGELEESLASLGSPESPWLTPVEGWREAWFPFTVWRPCRVKLGGPEEAAALGFNAEQVEVLRRASTSFPSEAECRAMMAPEWLRLYRRTTWGRQCRTGRASGNLASSEHVWLQRFCEALFEGAR